MMQGMCFGMFPLILLVLTRDFISRGTLILFRTESIGVNIPRYIP